MRNEDDRSMNVMRGILQACEEGATEELNDGSDGNEPWTEEDRRASLATAEWIRATFFTHSLPIGRPKLRRRIGEQLFTDEQLWEQFESAEPDRRRCAIEAIDALANLAEVRSRKRRTHFLVERHAVYDIALLNADLHSRDRELYDAAFRVWDEVSHLAALVACDESELTEEERKESGEILEWARARLAELEQAASERDRGGVREGTS